MTLCVNIRKTLPHFDVDIKFQCPAGSLTAFVGPSGAGKTTLIRAIAGLDRPDSGRITMSETCWVDTEKKIFVPARKRGLGLVFQDYTLFPHLSVRKNVAFAATNDELVDHLMEIFGISHLANKKPTEISGGERQRAAFCQALAREPVLLLLDEPFSALDVTTRRKLRTELRDFKNKLDIPVLHVTHDLEEAQFLGDTIIAVERGHISPDWFDKQLRIAQNICTQNNKEHS